MTYAPADTHFRARLLQDLSAEVLSDPPASYLQEPRQRWQGRAGLLARPRSTQEVATLVRIANAARVPVIPYAGGTGLVGGQVAENLPDPLILSLERMNKIRSIHPREDVIVAEAGMILADVQAAARDVDRLFPLSLAAEGSARIGGNLATNAGGTGVLRYGNTRDLCLGIEAVLPDGQVYSGLRRLRKDNTGYDLRHLLIGSEGTLGVITAASLKLFPRPEQSGAALIVVEDPSAALSLLSLARAQLGEGISAFELMHKQGLAFLQEVLPEIRLPFDELPEWCVLIELGVPKSQDIQACFAALFEAAVEQGLANDGLIASSQAQTDDFWRIRESIPEANRRIGSVSSHDISLPLSLIPDFIEQGRAVVAEIGAFRINCFGHLGDGNLHYNVFPLPGESRADHEDLRDHIKEALHDLVHAFGGSVSAEHGIGRLKVADLERYGDPVKLAAMRSIKAALDPNGIMNPGAVLREVAVSQD